MARLKRGIAPELLVSQVRNTMPYLFEGGAEARLLNLAPTKTVLGFEAGSELSHYEYFKLCVSSHILSCATPVPTDVDNQIRQKLWPKELPLEEALLMVRLVLEVRSWDLTALSDRFVMGSGEWKDESLSGHLGEWFTLACGAYCALKQWDASEAAAAREEVFSAIRDEVNRHSEIFGSLWRSADGVGCLKASASIAHNFGDLDRVMDMWELSVADPLRLECYKLTAQPLDSNRKLRHLGRLWVAGELYKSPIEGSSMALENHRHYALRKPRALRSSPRYFVPTGPFFDDWGRAVARGLKGSDGMPSEALLEVFTVLVEGWERQPKTLGYGRGLKGICEISPELAKREPTSQKDRKAMLGLDQETFQGRWAKRALEWIDEIPSRA